MHIVCPHCTTSYTIQPSSLSAGGRTLRCSRCKEIWVAYPEGQVEEVLAPAMAEAVVKTEAAKASNWSDFVSDFRARNKQANSPPPTVDSPSFVVDDWQEPAENADETEDEPAQEHPLDEVVDDDKSTPQQFQPRFPQPVRREGHARHRSSRRKTHFGLPTACFTMAGLVVALVVWRADVVRILPQTASFYQMVGLEVNLRGLAFKDVKFSTETIDGKQVWLIEGVVVDKTRKPVDIPRLRFAVRDAQGTEIYAWNTAVEQNVLKPGERAFFKSRLASPPSEGRNIDIRFVSPGEIAGSKA